MESVVTLQPQAMDTQACQQPRECYITPEIIEIMLQTKMCPLCLGPCRDRKSMGGVALHITLKHCITTTIDGMRKFKCPVVGCQRAYAVAIHLSRHIKEKHTGEMSLQCPCCLERFRDSFCLRRHQPHCKPIVQQPEHTGDTTEESDTDDSRPATPSEHTGYTTEESDTDDSRPAIPYFKPQGGDGEIENTRNISSQQPEALAPEVVQQPQEGCITPEIIKIMLRTKTCPLCPDVHRCQGYGNRGGVALHITRKHCITTTIDGMRKFKCPVVGCQRAYAVAKHLSRHIKEKHTSEGAFPCHACQRKFSESWRLRVHSCKPRVQPEHTGDTTEESDTDDDSSATSYWEPQGGARYAEEETEATDALLTLANHSHAAHTTEEGHE